MKIGKGFGVVLACFLLLFISIIPEESSAACSPPAQVVGHPDIVPAPTSIQNAYELARTDLALTEFTLRIAGDIIEEDLFLDGGVVVTLDGGYDCDFATKIFDLSGVFGSVTIGNGTLIAQDVRILSTNECSFDADLDGYTRIGSCLGTANDCNDNDPRVYPGAIELCDLQDNNCNGQVDEDPQPFDADGDGYYGSACGLGGGVWEDCNDADPNIYVGALEIPYDGIDQDCDGLDQVYPEGALGGDCRFCHGQGGGYPAEHAHVGPPDGTCVECHAPFVGNILPAHYGREVVTADNGMLPGSTIVCASCHDASRGFHSGGVQLGDGSNLVWSNVVAAQNAAQAVTCDTCHQDRATAHGTDDAHDFRAITDGCSDCHTSDTTTIGPSSTGTLSSNTDVDTLHNGDCALCHNYTGTKLNKDTVRDVVLLGRAGTSVDCLDCHTDKATGHIDFVHPISVGPNDLSYDPPGILCNKCHLVSTWAEIEGVVHNTPANGEGSCGTCHNSTDPTVVATIDRGTNPTRCTDCHTDKYLIEHGMVDHEALGYTAGGTTYCLDCHDSLEIVTVTHKFDCFLCHTNVPALKAELPTGADALNPNICTDCHSPIWDGLHRDNPPSHNSLVQVELTDCSECHSDPPLLVDPVDPKVHNDCDSCHDDFGGLIKFAVGKDFDTGGNCTICHTGTWETIHPNPPAAHSICTSCHDSETGSLLDFGQ